MSAVLVQPANLTEAMSYLLQIVTYLISDEGTGYKGSSTVQELHVRSPFDWQKENNVKQ